MTNPNDALQAKAREVARELHSLIHDADYFQHLCDADCSACRHISQSIAAFAKSYADAMVGAALQIVGYVLGTKSFPLTPHDTAEACVTLCDVQDTLREIAKDSLAALESERQKARKEEFGPCTWRKKVMPRNPHRAPVKGKKAKYRKGQVVFDRTDGTYLRIMRIEKDGTMWAEIERGGTLWYVDPSNVRKQTKRERGDD